MTTPPPASKGRILVVDDEEAVRDFVCQVLEMDGYEVAAAANGQEALDKIALAPPDLVVLDLMMPVLDGWGVLDRLGGVHPPVVVILSAMADRTRALRSGAVDCLAKPFDFKDLLRSCARAIAESGSATAQPTTH